MSTRVVSTAAFTSEQEKKHQEQNQHTFVIRLTRVEAEAHLTVGNADMLLPCVVIATDVILLKVIH